ncbi:hypothetical protein Ddye_012539 [Dipteronia dyeriana]|uniref:Uncharacterized protein n=1 Tax=Dipteronia dyeriana TaxID=168575 RepID=A0AAD9X4H7_9ROSI|nr:hypothetical protein Ddye_012539 [Dipteronia dyeriana]
MSVSTTETNQGGGYAHYQHHQYYLKDGASVCEIEEVESSELFEIEDGLPLETTKEDLFEGSLFSFDVHGYGTDHIYVAVGKSESSMDALLWTLKHAVNPSTVIYLIHIFPEIKHIPSPLGKLPKTQVNPEQVENYMAQERGKRRQLLQKFIHACSNSQVKVDTMLVESDAVAKALGDLIPILNIRKLVVGTTKSSLRKSKSRRGSGSGIADQLLHNAPETCEIKIVCEGKEVIDQMMETPSPRGRGNQRSQSPKSSLEENQSNDSFACLCFKSKFI